MKSVKKPNLIYIMADQLRRDALGFEGVFPVRSPVIDAFAAESLVFENAISTCPICTPYRAALFTGKYPLSTGMVTNCQAGLKLALDAREQCLTDVLKTAGYTTAYIGKWHLENPSRNGSATPEDGASHWDARTSPDRRHGIDFWYAYNAWDGHFKPHYWTADEKAAREIDAWGVDHETGIALRWLEARVPDQPFALFLSWNPPHPPYVAPDEFLEMYPVPDLIEGETGKRRRAYFAAVSSLDANLNRVLSWLEASGRADDTIVVFTADHGDMLGDHNRYGKTIWYKEALEVPFVIRWPGHIRQGKTDLLFGAVDIMPTLLSLMGMEIPVEVEGRNLAAHLSVGSMDVASSDPPCAQFFGCYANPGILQTVGQEATPYTRAGVELRESGIDWRRVGFRGVRTQRYTFVADRGNHTEEVFWTKEERRRKKPIDGSLIEFRLYDRLEDPTENAPYVSETCDTPLMREMAGLLRGFLASQGDPFRV